MEKQELLDLLAKRLTKNEYDKAEELLDKVINDAVNRYADDHNY